MAGVTSYLWGRSTLQGLTVAVVTCALDQAIKLWLLFAYELGNRGMVRLAPGIDFVLTWNTGISYGLFQTRGQTGQWILLGFKFVAVVVLWAWLARAQSRLTALGLGLIIGGAIGNAIDRLAYGAVADFVLLYLTTAQGRWNWYVFNLADAAIVAGVGLLLYESLWAGRAAKRP